MPVLLRLKQLLGQEMFGGYRFSNIFSEMSSLSQEPAKRIPTTKTLNGLINYPYLENYLQQLLL